MSNFKKFLLQKLKDEIKKDLLNEYTPDLDISKDEYDKIVNEKLNKYFNKTDINFTREKCQCMARIWNNGYGNEQCSRKTRYSTLCKKHKELYENDNLWLGLINEKRPDNPVHNGKIKRWKD